MLLLRHELPEQNCLLASCISSRKLPQQGFMVTCSSSMASGCQRMTTKALVLLLLLLLLVEQLLVQRQQASAHRDRVRGTWVVACSDEPRALRLDEGWQQRRNVLRVLSSLQAQPRPVAHQGAQLHTA
jgi:hypothetical protein